MVYLVLLLVVGAIGLAVSAVTARSQGLRTIGLLLAAGTVWAGVLLRLTDIRMQR